MKFPMTTPSPAPSIDALLEASIAASDARFNPEAGFLTAKGGGPGYHTRTTPDQTVHNTHDSANYAQMLLMRGAAGDVERASEILRGLVRLQVTDPESQHYGLWGWFVEEPPSLMAPADWNWADFIGTKLVEILGAHEQQLDRKLSLELKSALLHACRCIVKRNVGPGYTNICTMGAAVTMAAGEILADAGLLDYGRRRLAAQLDELSKDGGVPEYNSPHYGAVLILELERVLRLVRDQAALEIARAMHRRIWELTASQFHPGTGQWAGAQSRTYSVRLQPNHAYLIWSRTGIPPLGAEKMIFTPGPDYLQAAPQLLCPAEFRDRFAVLPESPHEIEQVWRKEENGQPVSVLRTWFSDSSTLGTVNRDTTWVQHRPLTAFWTAPGGDVASVKISLLKDAREFASGLLHSLQKGPRALLAFSMIAGQGDWHCILDRPADGFFSGSDLRLRISLDAAGATLESLPGGRFVLSSGAFKIVLHTAEILFDGHAGHWEAGKSESGVHLDAVLHTGRPLRFSPVELRATGTAVAVELLAVEDPACAAPLCGEVCGLDFAWEWAPVGRMAVAQDS